MVYVFKYGKNDLSTFLMPVSTSYRISSIARSNTLTTFIKVPISRTRTLLALSPALMWKFNSVSCGGSNIADKLAMFLWTAEVRLKAASELIRSFHPHSSKNSPTTSSTTRPNVTSVYALRTLAPYSFRTFKIFSQNSIWSYVDSRA
ncbi:hypothetical protein CPC08DRAFT_418603 [Agrocybe pediades]|nr:hypothetical protein CPC08DRAFT_418603 [Agrocybe pediades]